MLVAFQTLFVYVLLFLIMFLCGRKTAQTGKMTYVYVACLLYAIIFGLRYGVGVDFFGYLNGYESIRLYGAEQSKQEIGFFYLTKFIAQLNLHYGFYFAIIAYLQVRLITEAVKQDKYIYPMLSVTFILGCIWLSYCNGLRQILAFCIYAYAIRCIIEKRPFKYYLLLSIAFLFHKSALLLIIFYPIFRKKKEWISNIKLQYLCLAIALLMMYTGYVQNFIKQMESVLSLTGYDVYTQGEYSKYMISSTNISLGMGFFITLIQNVLIIYQSNNAKKWLNNAYFTIIYNLFFLGVLIKYVFISSQLVNRINYYFLGFDYLVGAYVLYYLYRKKRNLFYVLLALYILTFVAILYRMNENTALYIFNFQDSLFYIKHSLFTL